MCVIWRQIHCRSPSPGRIERWHVPPNPVGPLLEESSESEEKDSTLFEIGSIPSGPELYKCHMGPEKDGGGREGGPEGFQQKAPPGMVGKGVASQVQR